MRTYRLLFIRQRFKTGLAPMYVGLLALVSFSLLGFAFASLSGAGASAPGPEPSAFCPALREAKPANGSFEEALPPALEAQEARRRGVWM